MIAEHFHYVRPGADPFLVASEGAAWRQLLARSYALVVIGGITDALTIFGHATKDNDGITAFSRDVPRAAVDHQPRSEESLEQLRATNVGDLPNRLPAYRLPNAWQL